MPLQTSVAHAVQSESREPPQKAPNPHGSALENAFRVCSLGACPAPVTKVAANTLHNPSSARARRRGRKEREDFGDFAYKVPPQHVGAWRGPAAACSRSQRL